MNKKRRGAEAARKFTDAQQERQIAKELEEKGEHGPYDQAHSITGKPRKFCATRLSRQRESSASSACARASASVSTKTLKSSARTKRFLRTKSTIRSSATSSPKSLASSTIQRTMKWTLRRWPTRFGKTPATPIRSSKRLSLICPVWSFPPRPVCRSRPTRSRSRPSTRLRRHGLRPHCRW
jgi:hypothetical protein